MSHSGVIAGSNFLDTHESRRAIRKDVTEGHVLQTDLHGRDRVFFGSYFTCPRCGWHSRAMRHWTGAERRGTLHSNRSCPDSESESRPFDQLSLEAALGSVV